MTATVYGGKLPEVQDGFKKAGGTRDFIGNVHWLLGHKREFQAKISLHFIDDIHYSIAMVGFKRNGYTITSDGFNAHHVLWIRGYG